VGIHFFCDFLKNFILDVQFWVFLPSEHEGSFIVERAENFFPVSEAGPCRILEEFIGRDVKGICIDKTSTTDAGSAQYACLTVEGELLKSEKP